MDDMDSQYGNIWSVEAGEWFCPNGHEIGIKDEPCEDCIEDARNEIPDAPTRTDMLSDLAEYGINGLDKLADAGVKKMHDKWFPTVKLCKPIDIRALRITPEQVEDALDAITKQEER
jgi:hypothetical protein